MTIAAGDSSRTGQRLARILRPAKGAPASPQAAGGDERRWAPRKASASDGLILSSRHSNPIRCTIRDTSSSGALLELCDSQAAGFVDIMDLPHSFTLVFTSYRERTEVLCQIMRWTGRRVGVRYAGPFRTSASKPAGPRSAPRAKRV
jgi:hypothetical protein